MAKCLCGTDDRLDPTGMRRLYRGLRKHLRHALLSYINYYNQVRSAVRQRCSGTTCSSCPRPDSSEADSRRSPPRVRPDLICGRDRTPVMQSTANSLLAKPAAEGLANFTPGVFDPLAHHAALLESGIGTSRPFTEQQNCDSRWGFADSRGEP
jgi:hypothetical protein